MEKLYIFSKLSMWENDLLLEKFYEQPSQDVIDAIIDYSLVKEYYSYTLKKKISISLN